MRSGLLVTNGFVLAGVFVLAALGAAQRGTELLPRRSSPDLHRLPELETQVARSPSAQNVAALASTYLDLEEPGLASAVIHRAPPPVRHQPEITQLEARALLHRGRAREALAAARQTAERCGEAEEAPCPAWLRAKNARQVAFLEEVVAAGIEDPLADPAATQAAYERSTRAVRLIAILD